MSNANAAHGLPLYGIAVSKVLYEFDGPILFVAKVGMLKCLFLKLDENDQTQEFLSCYIDDDHIQGLEEGRLSIRGAFEAQADNYLIISDYSLRVFHERRATKEELNDGRLPQANVGVLPRFGECPDVLQIKDAFLSVYFRGAALSRDRIQYSTLMSLLGSVQNLAKNVVMPPELRKLRYSTFDFWVGDPALGSLMISIQEPKFNLGKLRQNPERRNITSEEVIGGFNRHKDEFFSEMEGIVDGAPGANTAMDSELYPSIRHLLPSDETPYSNVTFTTQDKGALKKVSIDRAKANEVRARYDKPEASTANRQGNIIEINAGSNTLLLRSRLGVVTTCWFDHHLFQILSVDQRFKIGNGLQVRGDLTERVRRDYLVVDRVLRLGGEVYVRPI